MRYAIRIWCRPNSCTAHICRKWYFCSRKIQEKEQNTERWEVICCVLRWLLCSLSFFHQNISVLRIQTGARSSYRSTLIAILTLKLHCVMPYRREHDWEWMVVVCCLWRVPEQQYDLIKIVCRTAHFFFSSSKDKLLSALHMRSHTDTDSLHKHTHTHTRTPVGLQRRGIRYFVFFFLILCQTRMNAKCATERLTQHWRWVERCGSGGTDWWVLGHSDSVVVI